MDPPALAVTVLFIVIVLYLVYSLHRIFPVRRKRSSSSSRLPERSCSDDSMASSQEELFHVPFMPFIPLFGIIVNYYLILQLSWGGMLSIVLYLLAATVMYYGYSIHHSVGNNAGWRDTPYCDTSTASDHGAIDVISPLN